MSGGCPCVKPPALVVEENRLKKMGGRFLGICGDENHDFGFHVPSCRLSSSDYSLRYGRGNPQHGAAFDAGMGFPGSRTWLLWLVAEARAGRKPGLVEVIGKPDGKPVLYWAEWNKWQAQTYTGAGHDTWTHLGINRTILAKATDLKLLAWSPTQKPPPPAPKPTPAKRPAPGPEIGFPLPTGWYFGPASGPEKSVSGEYASRYGKRFKGKYDYQWLQVWGNQMARRGWSVGKGKPWLRVYGNDGIYGSEWIALIKAFQKDQKLRVTGLLDATTWRAAFRNPIS